MGNGNSSSPSNTPQAKGSKFPGIRIADMVESQRRLLQHLNVSSVHAMLGVSMGGMQVFHWMVQHPTFMRKAIAIVSTPKMTEADVKLWSKAVPIGRAPANTTPDADPPASRFGVDKLLGMIAGGISQVPKYQQPFNPLRQFEAMVAHDVTKLTDRSLESAAQRIRASTMIIIATKDNALTTGLSIRMAEMLRAPLFKLEGPCGHKAYDCELDKIAAPIAQFLD